MGTQMLLSTGCQRRLDRECQTVRIKRDELLGSLPPEWPETLLPEIRAFVRKSAAKIVVVDDDPTGNQTVYDVPVLSEWSQATLAGVLAEPDPIVYLLTNSRSLTAARARAINRELGVNLAWASKTSGRDFVVISRSDSTLRGHYPDEVQALIEGLDQTFDATLIVPFFEEGGRLTVDDVHYVAEGDWLVPAAETEYARDAAFGYHTSNLRSWVSEKHKGKIKPGDVTSISLFDLRQGGPKAAAAELGRIHGGQTCVVNAASYRDLEVFVSGLLQAEASGQRFIYRTAASFVRIRAGIPPRTLLTAADLPRRETRGGGLLVVGSHVEKSTAQIEAVRRLRDISDIEVSVEKVLDSSRRDEEIARVARLASESLADGLDTLIYTSRRLIAGNDEESSLRIGQQVSTALVEIVSGLREDPAWIIAKGGITSSDIATGALGVKRAQVLGQALPGVPVWRTGQESRWPGLIYVVFPGNVGGPSAIADVIRLLRGSERR